MSSPRTQLAWLSLAMLLGMTLWFSATAANGPIVAEFHLSAGETAWLTMAVQGGFVLGTLVSAVLNLPDRLNARRMFALGCVIGALANASLVAAPGVRTLIALRVATGAALAWVYPPGMKVAASWFGDRRGMALGLLIGALTIGSAFPHLLASLSAAVPWRTLMLMASALATAGGVLIVVAVGDGPHIARTGKFERDAVARVFADRQTRLATLAYLGHMWELYAVWTWMAVFATAAVGNGLANGVSTRGSVIAFVTIASGALGSAAAGILADRFGNARIAAWAMVVSGTCCAVAGLVYRAPLALLVLFAILWGLSIVADSAQLSALIVHFSPCEHVGTALTIQTCVGFLLTMVSIRVLPIAAQAIGWQWVFLTLAPGPFLGALALRGLRDA